MKTNFKISAIAVLFSLALISCAKEETLRYTGKVSDLDSGEPIADANVELIISDGLDIKNNIINPDITSARSDNQGYYRFDLPSYDESKVYFLRTGKDGYITVPGQLGLMLIKKKSETVNDLHLAKGSNLTINFIKHPSSKALLSQLRLVSSAVIDNDVLGSSYIVETLDLKSSPGDSTIARSYHFRTTPSVTIKWMVITDGVEQEFTEEVSLAEYDTTTFEISY